MVRVPQRSFGDEPALGAAVLVLVVAGLLVAARLATTGDQRARVRDVLMPGDWWPRMQAVAIATVLLYPWAYVRLISEYVTGSRVNWFYLDGATVFVESKKEQIDRLRLEGTLRAGLAALATFVLMYLGESVGHSAVVDLALIGAMIWLWVVVHGILKGRLRVVPVEASEVSE